MHWTVLACFRRDVCAALLNLESGRNSASLDVVSRRSFQLKQSNEQIPQSLRQVTNVWKRHGNTELIAERVTETAQQRT